MSFESLTYDTANTRLGLRFLTLSQTAGIDFEDSESTDSGVDVISSGPVTLEMQTTLKVEASSAATCSSTEVTNAVSPVIGGALSATASGTSCGHSVWYTAAVEAQLATAKITKIGCVFSSFVAAQSANILWDPTVSTNTTNANTVFKASNGGSSSSSSGLG